MRQGLFASPRPDNLGLHDGMLAPAPSTPNGVSSQATDSKHYVAPLPMPQDCCVSAMEKLHGIIESMGHAEIVSEDGGYLPPSSTPPCWASSMMWKSSAMKRRG